VKNLVLFAAATTLGLTLGGCAGGGNSLATVGPVAPVPGPVLPAPPPGATTSPASGSSAVFTIKIPAALQSAPATHSFANSRRPLYVSSGTQSIKIALNSVNGVASSAVAPLIATLTPSSPNCSGSPLVCTVKFPSLPIGLDGFTLTTFDTTDATGAALSTNVAAGSILVGTLTNIPVTLEGVIASIGITVGSPSLVPGAASTHSITAVADDASGAQIIGAAPFSAGASVVLSTDDTHNTISIPTTSFTNPSALATATFAYSGVAIANGAEHINATATGLATVSAPIPVNIASETTSQVGTPIDATFTAGSPNVLNQGNDSTIALSFAQAGWGAPTNPFTIATSGAACSALSVTNTSGDTFSFVASGSTAGTCSVTISGGGGASQTFTDTLTGTPNGANFQVQSIKRAK
jgi:hypothetical protein